MPVLVVDPAIPEIWSNSSTLSRPPSLNQQSPTDNSMAKRSVVVAASQLGGKRFGDQEDLILGSHARELYCQ
jgi:hypothetical protein